MRPCLLVCVSALGVMESAQSCVRSHLGAGYSSVPTVGGLGNPGKGGMCKMEEFSRTFKSSLPACVSILQGAQLSSVWCPVEGVYAVTGLGW